MPSSGTRMRGSSPEHYDEGMTVVLCSKCGTAITPEPAEPAAVPDVSDDERDRDKETRRAPSTVPRGHYAIDPEPWGPPYAVQDDQEDPSRLSRADLWSAAHKASSSRPVRDTQCWCVPATPPISNACPMRRAATGAADREVTRGSTAPALRRSPRDPRGRPPRALRTAPRPRPDLRVLPVRPRSARG